MARSDSPINRREFLGSSAKNAAGVAAGVVGVGVGVGLVKAGTGPGDTVNLGIIGVRSQGKSLATALARLPGAHIATLCDVDDSVLATAVRAVAAEQGRTPAMERDFRRLLDDPAIDAVVIATPNHWHATMAAMTLQAGKDLYLETPVTHTLAEGQMLAAVAQSSNRIVAVGLPQRSGQQFLSAVDYLRSGRLGTVHLAKAWTVQQRKPIGRHADTAVPDGVDYDLWLGPAPARPFNVNRFHFNWQWFWDYGGGELGHWGVQMLDVARWGLGVGLPRQIAAMGGKHHFRDDQETPDTLLVNYAYPQATITWEHRLWSPFAQDGRSAAVAFHGDLGTLIVDRGGWKVYGGRDAPTAPGGDFLNPHLQDFLDCVRSRQQPACDLEAGRQSSALCHLGNIAYRLGRSVDFDPVRESFGSDRAAAGFANREPRGPWTL